MGVRCGLVGDAMGVCTGMAPWWALAGGRVLYLVSPMGPIQMYLKGGCWLQVAKGTRWAAWVQCIRWGARWVCDVTLWGALWAREESLRRYVTVSGHSILYYFGTEGT